MSIHSVKRIIIPLMAAFLLPAIAFLAWSLAPQQKVGAANKHIVTIHHDDQEQIVATDAETVEEVLQRAQIELGEHDAVEPAKAEKLIAPNYSINVYRARPITVVEGTKRYKILTPYQSAKKIAQAAGLEAYDEDNFKLDRIDNFIEEGGAGLKLTITRSIPVKAILYDKPVDMRTQAKTVKDFLQEKQITLKAGDKLFPAEETPITDNIAVAIYRDGSQAVKEEELPFETERIIDRDREVGFKEVKEAGAAGRRFVIYQLEQVGGKETQTELHSILIAQPKKQIEIIGGKTAGFSGGFGDALAKLRSCEGKYTSVNPAGPYYGAYQFNQGTWNSYAPAGYKGVAPNTTPPEVQDQAAAGLYKARGWQPWPACSRKLGLQDIYR
jgi:uncharacterized protein YabE (DUF348 family)